MSNTLDVYKAKLLLPLKLLDLEKKQKILIMTHMVGLMKLLRDRKPTSRVINLFPK